MRDSHTAISPVRLGKIVVLTGIFAIQRNWHAVCFYQSMRQQIHLQTYAYCLKNTVFIVLLGLLVSMHGFLLGQTADSIGLPAGLTVSAMLADQQIPTAIYAATLGDGVYKSADGGANWRKVSNGLPSGMVHALAFNPQNPAELYAATVDGICRTTDGGANWSLEIVSRAVLQDILARSTASERVAWQWQLAALHGSRSMTKRSAALKRTQNNGAIPSIERAALIALYNATGGDYWRYKVNWKTPPLDTDGFSMPGTESTWSGITVAGDHVQQINLYYFGLLGSIPVEIGNLTCLEKLELGENCLLGLVPATIANLTQLQELDLESWSSGLAGPFPAAFCKLANLKSLNLAYNSFSGPIPAEIGNLVNLEEIYFHHTSFSGPIPPEMGNLNKLTNLVLSNNKLTGSIPVEIGQLTKLIDLDLAYNGLTGNIPKAFGNLINVGGTGGLCLDHNRLSGTIPGVIGQLKNLTWLDVSCNQLIGAIPTELGMMGSQQQSVYVKIDFNGLWTKDTLLIAWLNQTSSGWATTQTIAPLDIQAVSVDNSSIKLSWTSILYSGDQGGYRVYVGTRSGGPYMFYGQTVDKTASSLQVTGLQLNTRYYIVVTTRTDAHAEQQNTLESEYSLETTTIIGGSSFTISGSITCAGAPVPEVVLNGLPGNPLTNAAGFYTAQVDKDWSGKVVPTLAGYTFAPASITYTAVNANSTAQNYNALKAYLLTFQSGEHGSLLGATIQIVEPNGAAKPVQALADNGYVFVNWTGTDGFASDLNPLTITNVVKDMTIIAHFAIGPTVHLQGQRLTETSWLLHRQFAQLDIVVENYASAHIARYEIRRGLDVIKTIIPTELASGHVTYIDKYLDKSLTYKYHVLAIDTNNTILATSELITL